MGKMSQEEKDARKAARAEAKRLQAIEDEKQRLIANRQCKIDMERARFISEPTRQFEVGELVEYGNHKQVEVVEVFDGGKFYELRAWGKVSKGTQGAGNPYENFIITQWTNLFKLESSDMIIPNLFKENEFHLNFSNQSIEGLLTKVYSFGVDFEAEYQRELVWTSEDKTLLIDSIMDSRDIGKFLFMRLPFTSSNTPMYQIVDGKQRLTTICEFFEDRFVWRGRKFSELSGYDRCRLTDHLVSVSEVNELSREKSLELFLFVNDTGKPISKEHLDTVRGMLNDVKEGAE